MRAVILAGGKGERLKPLTDTTRKAYLPLGNGRIVDHVIDKVPNGIDYVITEDDSGAASAVANCLEEKITTAILFGDNYFEGDLFEFFFRYGGYTVVGVYDVGSVDIARNLGVVSLDRNGFIEEFEEKPEEPKSTLAAIGVYRFPPIVFPFIREFASKNPRANAGELIINLLQHGVPVCTHPVQGPWFDIGTMKSYNAAKDYLFRRKNG